MLLPPPSHEGGSFSLFVAINTMGNTLLVEQDVCCNVEGGWRGRWVAWMLCVWRYGVAPYYAK